MSASRGQYDAASRPRRLVLVLGDQLDRDAAVFDDFDTELDAVWMAENAHEATHVRSHKIRIALFFSAMRHFRDALRDRGIVVHYHELQADARHDSGASFEDILKASVRSLSPSSLHVTHPGSWRVLNELQTAAESLGTELHVHDDRHFYCTKDEFAAWADDQKSLVLENFYRHLRRAHHVLVDDDGNPTGGEWNFDKQNRQTFGKDGPKNVPPAAHSTPDEITGDVIDLVENRFADHPGRLDDFDLPVTRRSALAHLRSFITDRLPHFGTYQDALWTGQDVLFHSRLSAALNLHLLNPREVVAAAIEAHEKGNAPINSVEGFVRQVLGWREFIRGVYWRFMPDYAERNALRCDDVDVPAAYWSGETEMNCIRESMRNVRDHAYAHHIQRLMILGLYAQLLGVHPWRFHEWHLAMYADAVDWVSLPNALGMSQWGDGGTVGTKPYCASGQYINRMSNYCRECRYRPDQSHGEDACPVTTLYWDFLARHERQFRKNPRMAFQLKNLEGKESGELKSIRSQAARIRKRDTGA